MPLKSFQIAQREFQLLLPDPVEMLEEAVAGESVGCSGWDPYWGLVWSAGPITAELLLRGTPRCRRALELGCGVGVCGVAAIAAGLPVTFSDQSSAAVEMARGNAARNGFADVPGLVFGWDAPPASEGRWDFLFGSDILYDRAGHEPLLRTIRQLLRPGGRVWIGDAGRANAPLFVELAEADGWSVKLFDQQLRPVRDFGHLSFRLIVMEADR
jgi:predicted nicotinamide N-methyase